MTTETPNTPAANAADEPLQFEINGQYIKDLSFENPNAPDCFINPVQPKMDVRVDANARSVGSDVYEVSLRIQARATRETLTLFLVELVYAGVFTLRNVPQNQIQPILLIECPRHLFPFARNIVADVTRDGGFPPLLLQPIDFVALFRNQILQENQPQEATPAVANEQAATSEKKKKA